MTRQTKQPISATSAIDSMDIKFYIEVIHGPDTYAAWSGSDTTSITSVDLYSAAEEDARRYDKAWRELARS